jgi:hypothetical protein
MNTGNPGGLAIGHSRNGRTDGGRYTTSPAVFSAIHNGDVLIDYGNLNDKDKNLNLVMQELFDLDAPSAFGAHTKRSGPPTPLYPFKRFPLPAWRFLTA